MAHEELARVLAGRPQERSSPLQNLARNLPFASEGPYQTNLQPQQEATFRDWVKTNNVPFDPNQQTQDYDMRGFWGALQSGDPRARSAVDPNDKRLHYPDVWKTPYHETFSNESQWAGSGAPQWQGDRLYDPSGRTLFDPRRR